MAKGMCGRCYAENVEIFSATCDEKPEQLSGQPVGQYHCPDCGAMVVAGLPHPKLCEQCLRGRSNISEREHWHLVYD